MYQCLPDLWLPDICYLHWYAHCICVLLKKWKLFVYIFGKCQLFIYNLDVFQLDFSMFFLWVFILDSYYSSFTMGGSILKSLSILRWGLSFVICSVGSNLKIRTSKFPNIVFVHINRTRTPSLVTQTKKICLLSKIRTSNTIRPNTSSLGLSHLLWSDKLVVMHFSRVNRAFTRATRLCPQK